MVRNVVNVDLPGNEGHQQFNILHQALDSSEMFTQNLVNDINTLEEEVTYTSIPVVDGSLPRLSFTVPRCKVDII